MGCVPLPKSWFKLNNDGSFKGNPGPAGAGGTIWNHNGDRIAGYTQHLGIL